MELVRFEGALIGYRAPLAPPLSFSVRASERLAVLGPNGSGKSTLIRSLLGLQPLLGGMRIFPSGRPPRIGYVPQSHRADSVYPLTALEVTLQGRMGLRGVFGLLGKEDRRVAAERLARVGLGDFTDVPLRELSGGQKQRVLLARALASEPELLVLDEFTSELDPAAAHALLAEVEALAVGGMGLVFVTHDVPAAVEHATHLVLLDGPRGLFETGPAEETLTSERLSKLYARAVRIDRSGGKTVVFFESGAVSP